LHWWLIWLASDHTLNSWSIEFPYKRGYSLRDILHISNVNTQIMDAKSAFKKTKESNLSNGSRVAKSEICQHSIMWITRAWLPRAYLDYLRVSRHIMQFAIRWYNWHIKITLKKDIFQLIFHGGMSKICKCDWLCPCHKISQ
jgi:hypothetical protein